MFDVSNGVVKYEVTINIFAKCVDIKFIHNTYVAFTSMCVIGGYYGSI